MGQVESTLAVKTESYVHLKNDIRNALPRVCGCLTLVPRVEEYGEGGVANKGPPSVLVLQSLLPAVWTEVAMGPAATSTVPGPWLIAYPRL